MTAPSDNIYTGVPAIVGGFPEGEPASLGDANSPTPGTFSVSWLDAMDDVPGDYQIARITFPRGVYPQIHPLSNTAQVSPNATVLVPPIPEPAMALALTVMGLVPLCLQRRCHGR